MRNVGSRACVLLSGGMDSSAALVWVCKQTSYKSVHAVMFDYGQPNRDQELTFAGKLAGTLGVPVSTVCLADALPRGFGILKAEVPNDDGRRDGVSPAFVPGRNLVFLACAAARASVTFSNGAIDLVVGCNAQDASRFPDCSSGALVKMGEALRHGLGREIQVIAPFVSMTKVEILKSLEPTEVALVAMSWSCYRGAGPCGTCGACVLRAEAFNDAGLEDLSKEIRMFGGE